MDGSLKHLPGEGAAQRQGGGEEEVQVAGDEEQVEGRKEGRQQQHGEQGHEDHHQQLFGQEQAEYRGELLHAGQIGEDAGEEEGQHQDEE